MIELKDVRKSFGKNEVLKGINLQIDKGEVVVIIGPSGSGKSTLLAIAGLLLSADEGRISIAGQDLTGHQAKASGAKTPRIAWLHLSRSPAPLLYENR